LPAAAGVAILGDMDPNPRRERMRDEWLALDAALWTTHSVVEMLTVWPWDSSVPAVQAAWEALTRPEHLADLEYRLACHDGGSHRMHDWAETVTRKAVEVCQSRAD
jgi:hypothetical protein